MSSTVISEGFVWLVGAGPGDPGLLTLRGRELLERADAVVYDELANRALLDFAPPAAERIYVGKKAEQHHRTQQEIARLLVAQARAGRRVVRLKGGDPLIFGRGGEEAEVLQAAGIGYEIVPGVTAAAGAGATTAIPLTHREDASAVIFVTGHECVGKRTAGLDWEAIVRTRATLCIYMGLRQLPHLAHRLVHAGAALELPIAVISRATWPDERMVVGTLGTIEGVAAEAVLPSPAILIVGEVVRRSPRAAAALAAMVPATVPPSP
jgi:uroporphyrin-III C-methyltransferase